MTICIVDTSVLCNILPVPGRDQERDQVMEDFELYLRDGAHLLLPVAVVLETGRHIAHLSDGSQRRRTAECLSNAVTTEPAAAPEKPFELVGQLSPTRLETHLADFPDRAQSEVTLTDALLIEQFELQLAANEAQRVLIWSLDSDLEGYDQDARFNP